MIHCALRDLQFRRRRFLIAVVGAALVFSLSLAIQGLVESFDREVRQTVGIAGAAQWFVADSSPGPFTGFKPLPAGTADELTAAGAEGVSELLVIREPLGRGRDRKDGGLVGGVPGQVGMPTDVTSGRPVRRSGEALVSDTAGLSPGDEVVVGGLPLEVVGTVDATLLAGTTTVYTTIGDARRIVGAGPLTTVLVSSSAPRAVPDGLTMMGPAEVRRVTKRPLEDAAGTIGMVRTLLWLVAALIVGAILYLNATERSRDVAVFKAMGISTRSIVGGMLAQAVVIAVAAAVLADLLAFVIAPQFPMRSTVTTTSLLFMPVLAVVIACVSSIAGIRRSVSVSPAMAFGGP